MAAILIIDDSMIVRSSLEKQCASKGHSTLAAESGEEGLALLHKNQVDLIITDILMPGMNGDDVIRHVKRTPSLAAIPILVISGQSSQEDIVRCLELGAEDLLSKPFVPEILHARISSSLERSEFRKREIHMREALAAEKCIQEMRGAICHNFSQPLTSAICNLSTLQKFLDRLVQLFNHVRSGMDPETRNACDEMAKEFVLKNRGNALIDDLFQGVHETAEDTFRSLKRICSLIHDLQSLVRPFTTNYLNDVDIIDFEQSKKHTILIACADEERLSRFCEVTGAMGYHILSSQTPKDAVSLAVFSAPHLIIIDSCPEKDENFTEILRLKTMEELRMPVMVIADALQPATSKQFSGVIDKLLTKAEADSSEYLKACIQSLTHTA